MNTTLIAQSPGPTFTISVEKHFQTKLFIVRVYREFDRLGRVQSFGKKTPIRWSDPMTKKECVSESYRLIRVLQGSKQLIIDEEYRGMFT